MPDTEKDNLLGLPAEALETIAPEILSQITPALIKGIERDWVLQILKGPRPLQSLRKFKEGINQVDPASRTSRNGVEKMDTANFRGEPVKFDKVEVIPADSPVVALVNPKEDLETFASFLFRMNKTEMHATQSKGVLESLNKGGWTKLEFEYALDAMEHCSTDSDLMKELRYSKKIVSIHFNMVRQKARVQSGRLHNMEHAVRIAKHVRRGLLDVFMPVRVAPGDGETLFMLIPQ